MEVFPWPRNNAQALLEVGVPNANIKISDLARIVAVEAGYPPTKEGHTLFLGVFPCITQARVSSQITMGKPAAGWNALGEEEAQPTWVAIAPAPGVKYTRYPRLTVRSLRDEDVYAESGVRTRVTLALALSRGGDF